MLTKEKAEALMRLLDNKTESLFSICGKYRTEFDFKRRIISNKALSYFLLDGVLGHQQQFVAFWILLHEYDFSNIDANPFNVVFRFLYNAKETKPFAVSPQLHECLLCVLNGVSIESLSCQSISHIFSTKFVSPLPGNITVPAHAPQTSCRRRCSPLVIEHVSSPHTQNLMTQTNVCVQLLCNETYMDSFEPPFLRIAPELYPITDEEIQSTFIMSFSSPPHIFDECHSIRSRESAITLIRKAAETVLRPAEIESLVAEIEKDPQIVDDADLPIDKIFSMIPLNSKIAGPVISRLAANNKDIIDRLAKLDLSPSSLETLLVVFLNNEISPSVLCQFCDNSIANLKSTRDFSSLQKKTAGFCNFIVSLFQSGVVFSEILWINLLSFYIDFSSKNIPELSELNDKVLSKK